MSSSRSTSASDGNTKRQQTASATVSAPPTTTAGTAPISAAATPGLERAELVRRADEHPLDGVDAPAHVVRRRQGDHRRANVHREHVDEAADREREQREQERAGEPEDDHARAERADGEQGACGRRGRHRPAGEADRTDQRTDGDRAAQHAEAERADVQDRLREQRQQRDGAAEQHGEEVERDRAEEDRRPADESDPGEHAAVARERRGRRRARWRGHLSSSADDTSISTSPST